MGQLLDKLNVIEMQLTKNFISFTLYLKSKMQKLSSILWLYYTMNVSQLILDFILNSIKSSVWLKEYAVIIISSSHPLACVPPCLQIDNSVFSHMLPALIARCCLLGMLSAVRPFCCRGSCELLEQHAQSSPTLCLWLCLHDSGIQWLSVTAHCALILFPANKRLPWHNDFIGLNLCLIQ